MELHALESSAQFPLEKVRELPLIKSVSEGQWCELTDSSSFTKPNSVQRWTALSFSNAQPTSGTWVMSVFSEAFSKCGEKIAN